MMSDERTCHGCTNFVPIGGGDHLCIAETEPKVIVEDYVTTEEFYWCGGDKFIE